jgi:hypothetical protein
MIDVWDLARQISDIARTTTDADTGVRLMNLVEQLLREAGLPEGGGGGGDVPGNWTSLPMGAFCWGPV